MRARMLLAVAMLFAIFAPAARAGDDDLAVIIPIKAYDFAGEVKYAHRDAQAIKDALVRVVGIPKGRIIERPDAGLATMRALLGSPSRPGEIASYFTGRKAKRLWVYFSGHGVPGPGATLGTFEPYLMPKDARPGSLELTALRLGEIEAVLETIRERFIAPDGQVVLALEACFSGKSEAGEIVKETSAGAFSLPKRTGGGLVVLSAADAGELASWDRDAQHGLFTDLLVDALFGLGRQDGQGALTLGGLEAHFGKALPGRLAALFPGEGRVQRPRLDGPRGIVISDGKVRARDPGKTDEAALKCNAYRYLQDPELIEAFVRRCAACTHECRATLAARISALREDRGRCARETATVEEMVRIGEAGRPALTSLKASLRCPGALERLDAALKVDREMEEAEAGRRLAKQKRAAADAEAKRIAAEKAQAKAAQEVIRKRNEAAAEEARQRAVLAKKTADEESRRASERRRQAEQSSERSAKSGASMHPVEKSRAGSTSRPGRGGTCSGWVSFGAPCTDAAGRTCIRHSPDSIQCN